MANERMNKTMYNVYSWNISTLTLLFIHFYSYSYSHNVNWTSTINVFTRPPPSNTCRHSTTVCLAPELLNIIEPGASYVPLTHYILYFVVTHCNFQIAITIHIFVLRRTDKNCIVVNPQEINNSKLKRLENVLHDSSPILLRGVVVE